MFASRKLLEIQDYVTDALELKSARGFVDNSPLCPQPLESKESIFILKGNTYFVLA